MGSGAPAMKEGVAMAKTIEDKLGRTDPRPHSG